MDLVQSLSKPVQLEPCALSKVHIQSHNTTSRVAPYLLKRAIQQKLLLAVLVGLLFTDDECLWSCLERSAFIPCIDILMWL